MSQMSMAIGAGTIVPHGSSSTTDYHQNQQQQTTFSGSVNPQHLKQDDIIRQPSVSSCYSPWQREATATAMSHLLAGRVGNQYGIGAGETTEDSDGSGNMVLNFIQKKSTKKADYAS